jgi:hypothetical protein
LSFYTCNPCLKQICQFPQKYFHNHLGGKSIDCDAIFSKKVTYRDFRNHMEDMHFSLKLQATSLHCDLHCKVDHFKSLKEEESSKK